MCEMFELLMLIKKWIKVGDDLFTINRLTIKKFYSTNANSGTF